MTPCAGCRQPFTPKRKGRRYCSQQCYATSPKPTRRTGAELVCDWCCYPFYAPKCRTDIARFCSTECLNAWQSRNKVEHTCQQCGDTFRWSPSRSASGNYSITYCSLACRDADPSRRAMLLELNARQQAGNPTRPELIGYRLLDLCGVHYLPQTVFNGKFTPDAQVPSARLIVQFDGDYWHDRAGDSTEPRIQRRVALDRSQDAYANACRWRVLRLWETDLIRDEAECLDRLRDALLEVAA